MQVRNGIHILNTTKEVIMKLIKSIAVVALALAMSLPAVQAGHHNETEAKNIVETAAAAGQFNTLIAAAKAAGLAGALSGDGPLTVFAPTDEAFNALPAGTIETLLKPENKDRLAQILTYHVIAGRVGSGALADGAQLDTLAGATALISAAESGFTIQGARIIATDIDASNGLVHVIDRVILPPEPMARSNAATIISKAIGHGVPMFNEGNVAATVAVYTMATESLLGLASAEMNKMEINRLERGLTEAMHSGSASERAWKLRYALDDVNASLHGGGKMMVVQSEMSR
jgi:uncharacterized surface protein with fasciclin (FAS1) repeats